MAGHFRDVSETSYAGRSRFDGQANNTWRNDQNHYPESFNRDTAQPGQRARDSHYPSDTHDFPAEAIPFITQPQNSTAHYGLRSRMTGASPPSEPGATPVGQWAPQPSPGSPGMIETSKPATTPSSAKPLWKVWGLEIICVALGFAAFAVIVIVLAWFDQHSLPSWPSQITLNTFVAFVTTIGKAAFMFPVPKAISQIQWAWFRRERPLYDIHVFDQASRGVMGSLVLLWRIRFRHFVVLGAVLMSLSFLTSPITQLAISYPMRDVLAITGEAKAPAIRTINAPKDRLDIATRKAMLISTVEDGTNFLRPIEPLGTLCSTGNCTFEPYQSLGICMRRANITSHLQIQEFNNVEVGDLPLLGDDEGASIIPGEKVWNASLGGGYDMLHQSPLSMLTDTLNGGATLGFANMTSLLQTRITSVVLIYTTLLLTDAAAKNLSASADVTEVLASVSDFRHEAMEVMFHLCVQTYDSNVHMGVEKNRLAGSTHEPIGLDDEVFLDMRCKNIVHDKGLACETKPDRWNEVLHLKGPAGTNSTSGENGFSANYRSMEMMASTMKNGMAGYARAQYHPKYYPNAEVYNGGGDLVQTLFQDVVYNLDGIASLPRRNIGFTNFYLNIATALSSVIRVGQPQKFTHSGFDVTGKAWKEAPYVRITWGWLAFLAAELVLAAGFLFLTIIAQIRSGSKRQSHQEGGQFPRDAKDSSLAALVALNEACRETVGGGVRPASEMKKTAKGVMVRLEGRELVPTVEGPLPPFKSNPGQQWI
ncbi:hypothetical protein ANO14919_034690 [Xylariales sp. No.14919]|nr:hypothetical protein ANO14919_034690 [Xylariales sp. No.14919]